MARKVLLVSCTHCSTSSVSSPAGTGTVSIRYRYSECQVHRRDIIQVCGFRNLLSIIMYVCTTEFDEQLHYFHCWMTIHNRDNCFAKWVSTLKVTIKSNNIQREFTCSVLEVSESGIRDLSRAVEIDSFEVMLSWEHYTRQVLALSHSPSVRVNRRVVTCSSLNIWRAVECCKLTAVQFNWFASNSCSAGQPAARDDVTHT